MVFRCHTRVYEQNTREISVLPCPDMAPRSATAVLFWVWSNVELAPETAGTKAQSLYRQSSHEILRTWNTGVERLSVAPGIGILSRAFTAATSAAGTVDRHRRCILCARGKEAPHGISQPLATGAWYGSGHSAADHTRRRRILRWLARAFCNAPAPYRQEARGCGL